MNYVIFSDSSCNLSDQTINDLDINIAPLVYIQNGKQELSYTKGQDTNLKAFFELLRSKAEVSTSCVNEQSFADLFEPFLKAGQDILYIGFSSGVSNTFNCGDRACKSLSEQYPDRKLLAVDTLSGSLGEGLLVKKASEMRLAGASFDDVATWVKDNAKKSIHLFTADDLHWLHKGGRISKASLIIGSLAKIKPLMDISNEGKIVSSGKALGRKRAIIDLANKLADQISNPSEQTIFISHGDCLEDAEFLQKKILEKVQVKDFYINYLDQVMGVHGGPGLLGAYFLGKERRV